MISGLGSRAGCCAGACFLGRYSKLRTLLTGGCGKEVQAYGAMLGLSALRTYGLAAWFTARHPHASRPSLIGEILAPPLSRGVAASLVAVSNLFPHPAPLSGSSEIGGVRAGARVSPGQPLGRPPSQGPPRRVVPDDAAALWSRTSPAPCLRHPPEW